MAAIKGISKVKTKVGFSSKRSTSVPMPKLKGNVSPKKMKDNRIYKKSVLQQDPSLFNNVGFGETGMTGED